MNSYESFKSILILNTIPTNLAAFGKYFGAPLKVVAAVRFIFKHVRMFRVFGELTDPSVSYVQRTQW